MIGTGAKSLHDRVAIITGASRGIGRAIAVELGRRDAIVVAVSRATDDSASIQRTAQLIETGGGKALAVPADIRDEGQVMKMIERVLNAYSRMDILVNNAGIMGGEIPFMEITPSIWWEIIDTNLTGAYLCCRAVIPAMLRQGGGVIVNVTSGAAVRTGFLNVPYGVSKAGLDRFTLGLGAEFKAQGIACISLSPPVSDTETVRRLYPDRRVEAWAQPPERTAEALCMLLEDDPMRFTGQVVTVNGYLESRRRAAQ